MRKNFWAVVAVAAASSGQAWAGGVWNVPRVMDSAGAMSRAMASGSAAPAASVARSLTPEGLAKYRQIAEYAAAKSPDGVCSEDENNCIYLKKKGLEVWFTEDPPADADNPWGELVGTLYQKYWIFEISLSGRIAGVVRGVPIAAFMGATTDAEVAEIIKTKSVKADLREPDIQAMLQKSIAFWMGYQIPAAGAPAEPAPVPASKN